jgi:hypothetical protein
MSPRDGASGVSYERAVPGYVDDAFEQSLARLSMHLATRPPPLPPEDWVAVARHSKAWRYSVAFAVLTLSGAVYWYLPSSTTLEIPPTASSTAVQASPMPSPAPPVSKPTTPSPEQPPLPPEPVTAVRVVLQAPQAVPPPAESPIPTIAQLPPDAAGIMAIQRRLVALGMDLGPIDGIAGPRTIAAVQRYHVLKDKPSLQQATVR